MVHLMVSIAPTTFQVITIVVKKLQTLGKSIVQMGHDAHVVSI